MLEQRKVITVFFDGDIGDYTVPADIDAHLWKGPHGAILVVGLKKRHNRDFLVALRGIRSHFHSLPGLVIAEHLLEVDSGKIMSAPISPSVSFQGRPREILITEQLADLYQDHFYFSPAPHPGFVRLSFNEESQSIKVFQKQSPLLAREKETSLHAELFNQVTVDHGQAISFTGETGMGKSRILDYFVRQCQESNFPVFVGKNPLDTTDSYHAFREIVAQMLRQPSFLLRLKSDLTPEEISYLEIFSGYQPTQNPALTPNINSEQKAFEYTIRKALRVIAKKPCAIVIDDLDISGDDIYAFLDYIFRDFENYAMLLVCTHRSTFIPPWHQNLDYNAYPLSPLTQESTQQMIAYHLDVEQVVNDLQEIIFSRSRGNPLMIERLVSHASRHGYIDIRMNRHGQTVAHPKGNFELIPMDLETLISAQIDELKSHEKTALNYIACFGFHGNADLVQSFFNQAPEKFNSLQLNLFFELGILHKTQVYPHTGYAFSQDIVFKTVLRRIPPTSFKQSHAEIGRFLESTLQNKLEVERDQMAIALTRHFFEADDAKQAFHYGRSATRYLNRVYRYEEAHKIFQNLGQHFSRCEDQYQDILPAYAKTLALLGKIDALEELLIMWRKRYNACSIELQREYCLQKMTFLMDLQKHKRALIFYRKTTKQKDIFDLNFKRKIYPLALNCQYRLGRNKHMLHEAYWYLRTFPQMDHWSRQVWESISLMSMRKGRMPQFTVMALFNSYADQINEDVTARISFLFALQSVLFSLEINDPLPQVFSEMISLAQKHNLRFDLNKIYIRRSIFFIREGRFYEAIHDLERAQKELKDIGAYNEQYDALIRLADCYLDCGAIQKADGLLRALSHPQFSHKNSMQLGIEHILIGMFYVYQLQFDIAAEQFKLATSVFQGRGETSSLIREKVRLYICRINLKENTPEEKTQIFKDFERDIARYGYDNLSRQIQAFVKLAAFYFSIQGFDSKYLDADSAIENLTSESFLKQWLYVAKISWLRHKNKVSQAKQLVRVYQQYRLSLQNMVPPDFVAEFKSHPLFGLEITEQADGLNQKESA